MGIFDYIDVTIFAEPLYAAILAFLITIIVKYIDDTYVVKQKCKLVRHLKTCIYVAVIVGLFVYLCKYALTGGQGLPQTTPSYDEFAAMQNGGMQNGGMIMSAMGEPVYLDLENI